jgi:LPS-assembly protein
MNKAISCVFAALILIALSNLFLYAEEAEINAGYLQYDDVEQFMVARSSVTIKWKNKLIKADTVQYWIDADYVQAYGHVILKENDNAIFADTLSYNLKTETGTLNKVSAVFNPWIFHTPKAIKINDKTYTTNTAKYTTCDLPKPHYYIYATRSKIITGKRIYIYNPVFIARGIPIFYMPLFTQGLGKKRDSLEIYPGYNNLDGFTARIIYGHPWTEHTYSKLYIDYFAKRGLGLGTEFNYDVPGKIRGTFYGYNIKEKNTDSFGIDTYNERWNIKAENWMKLNALWTAQSKLNFESDASFNNLYYQENWMRIARQLDSSVSFARQTSKDIFRISAARTDQYNAAANDFKPANITFPFVEYSKYPQKIYLGLYLTYNFNLQNQYTIADDFYTWSSLANINIYKNYNISRKLTLTPSVGANETWSNKTPIISTYSTTYTGYNSALVTRFLTGLNMKYRITRWMDWNLTQQYTIRSKNNLLDMDNNGIDYGEETNQFIFRDAIYLSRKVILRNSISYDFKRYRIFPDEDWRQKFTPLVNELTWQPAFMYTFYAKESTNIYPHNLGSAQVMFMYGMKETKYLNLGVFYNGTTPDLADFNIGLGFNPTAKWRVEYNIYSTAARDLREIRMNDQELKVTRDLHCWLLGVRFLRRLDYEEVYVTIDLKTSFTKRKELYNRPHEQEFYPWR